MSGWLLEVLWLFGLKAGLIVALALLVAGRIPGDQVADRLTVWRTAVLALVLLVPLSALLPAVTIELPGLTQPPTVEPVSSLPTLASGTPTAVERRPGLPPLAESLYLIGTGFAAISLLMGLIGLTRWLRRARTATPPIPELVADLRAGLGERRRIDVRWSDDVATPLSWGLLRPRILLPDHWRPQTPDLLHNALAHELAHIRRLDWLWLMAARALLVVGWFNPMLYLLVRRMTEDTEAACDQLAVSLSTSPGGYARALLTAADGPHAVPALSMRGAGGLGRRIELLMNPASRRETMNRLQKSLVHSVLPLIVIPLAACQLTQAAEAPVPAADPVPVATAPAAPAPLSASTPAATATPSAVPRVAPTPATDPVAPPSPSAPVAGEPVAPAPPVAVRAAESYRQAEERAEAARQLAIQAERAHYQAQRAAGHAQRDAEREAARAYREAERAQRERKQREQERQHRSDREQEQLAFERLELARERERIEYERRNLESMAAELEQMRRNLEEQRRELERQRDSDTPSQK